MTGRADYLELGDCKELDELFTEVELFIDRTPRVPVTEGTKFCNGCKTVKPITEFNNRKDRGSSDRYGKVPRCRDCTTKQAKDWYYRDPEKTKLLARATQYRRRHKGRISKEEAVSLAVRNVGYCDLCCDYGIIFIDHNHETGARRGFLCSRCNFALGGFQDSAELLQKAAAYILRYRDIA